MKEPICGTNPQTTNANELLTLGKCAEEVPCHVNTIRNKVASGELPAVRIGARIIRVRRADLEALFTPYKSGEYGIWRGQVGGN